MPPKRRNNVPDSAAKGRRPRVAGTRQATPKPPRSETPVTQTEPVAKPEPAKKPEPVAKPEAATTAAAVASSTTSAETAKTSDTDTTVSLAKPVSTAKAASAGKTKVPNLQPRISTQQAPAAAETAAADTGSGRITWKLVGILGAVAVVLGVFAVVAAFKPGADITNTAWVDEGATAEVTKAGTEAIETLYTYSYETIDQDFDKARGYLDDAKRDEFDSTADTTKQAAIQTKTATQASVTDIGVTMLDGDRAELLAHMNVSATGDAVAQGSAATPLSIKMEKIDGKWVLTDISDSEG
ncbi:Mce-associated membrane protein [Rhodococcus wratislaviensis]|uniref:Mce associated protein mas4b n=1 Tax=Rhodococcus wratislaviensis TaxID=44752 RepID=A0AB38FLM2_RHOWR|nr:Mce-associated membrane protein [Rhodococcus wratislaviensis]SPZ42384.1 mce associated protein mas4b [Rhodococcus wratislaviensis]